jgi:hypothetical protein
VAYPPFARSLAERLAPGLLADRARRYERDLREQQGIAEIARQLIGDAPMVVRDGPFAGLRYPEARVAEIDAPVAKLLGTYEQELHPVFTAALARGVNTFIDVGSADGYYAVGLPAADRRITTYAFDLSRSARELCAEVARLNDVSGQVRIGKRFSLASLSPIDPAGALMLCDIEGAEAALFEAGLVRRLGLTTVVIEVHEHVVPGLSDQLSAAFAATHLVTRIEQAPRETSHGLPATAFSEFRPSDQNWLVCEPRQRL